MNISNWMALFIIGAACVLLTNAGTVPPSAEPVHEGGEIEPYKKGKKECTDNNQCSCTGGIPICHEGFCNCILTHLVCFENKHCGDLCESGIGVCLANACKCYYLVEDTKLTESISPWGTGQQLPL